MNKSIEFVADGKTGPYSTKVNANYLLKLFAKFTEKKSKTVILQGISGSKSLVRRNDKWTPL